MHVLLVDSDSLRGADLIEKFARLGHAVSWCKDNQATGISLKEVFDVICFHIGDLGWVSDSKIGLLSVFRSEKNYPVVMFTGSASGIRDIKKYVASGYGVPRAIKSSLSATHDEWKEFFEWAVQPNEEYLPRLLRPQFNPLLHPLMLFCEAYQNAVIAENPQAVTRIPDDVLDKLRTAQVKQWFESPGHFFSILSSELTAVLPTLPDTSLKVHLSQFLSVAKKLSIESGGDSGSLDWIKLAGELRAEIDSYINPKIARIPEGSK